MEKTQVQLKGTVKHKPENIPLIVYTGAGRVPPPQAEASFSVTLINMGETEWLYKTLAELFNVNIHKKRKQKSAFSHTGKYILTNELHMVWERGASGEEWARWHNGGQEGRGWLLVNGKPASNFLP